MYRQIQPEVATVPVQMNSTTTQCCKSYKLKPTAGTTPKVVSR